MSKSERLTFIKDPIGISDDKLKIRLMFYYEKERGHVLHMADGYIDDKGNRYRSITGCVGSYVHITCHSLQGKPVIRFAGTIADPYSCYESEFYMNLEVGLEAALKRLITQVRRYANRHSISFDKADLKRIREFYRAKWPAILEEMGAAQ